MGLENNFVKPRPNKVRPLLSAAKIEKCLTWTLQFLAM